MRIEIIQGDITSLPVDVIVNAANTSLLGGGGEDGAIHKKGGPQILADCIKIRDSQGGCATGDAVYTQAGNLQAKYVIHTVGPVWQSGLANEKELLQSCYQKSLRLADSLHAQSIAFPNISTGIYGFPKALAAEIVYQLIIQWLPNQPFKTLEKILFVTYDSENFRIYTTTFRDMEND